MVDSDSAKSVRGLLSGTTGFGIGKLTCPVDGGVIILRPADSRCEGAEPTCLLILEVKSC